MSDTGPIPKQTLYILLEMEDGSNVIRFVNIYATIEEAEREADARAQMSNTAFIVRSDGFFPPV